MYNLKSIRRDKNEEKITYTCICYKYNDAYHPILIKFEFQNNSINEYNYEDFKVLELFPVGTLDDKDLICIFRTIWWEENYGIKQRGYFPTQLETDFNFENVD